MILKIFSANENYSNNRASVLILIARLAQLHKDWKSTIFCLNKVHEFKKNRLNVLVSLAENNLLLDKHDKALTYYNILKKMC